MSNDKSLTEQIVTTRRSVLASLGVAAGAGAAVVGGADHDGDSTESLQSGGIHANLTEQRQRETYVTAPGAQVDTGVLSPGEFVVESDTGKRYIWDGSQLVDPGLETESVRTEEIISDSKPQIDVYVDNDSGDYRAVGPFDFLPLTNSSDVLELLDAIDNSLSSPAKIHVGGGDYAIDNTFSDGAEFEVTTSGLTLTGDGAATHMRLVDGVTGDDEGSKLIEVHYDASQVTFKNFFLDGNYHNQNPDGIGTSDGHNIAVFGDEFHMEGVYSWNATGDNIEGFGTQTGFSKNATIDGCHFKDAFEQNVHFNGCEDWQVSNCIIKDEVQNGMVSTYNGTGTRRCILTDNIYIGGDQSCLEFTTGPGSIEDIRVEGGIIYNPSIDGVEITEASNANATPKNIYIDVEIISPGRDGIRLTARGEMENITLKGRVRDAGHTGVNILGDFNGDYTDITCETDIINPQTDSTGVAIAMNPDDGTFTRTTVGPAKIISKSAESDVDNAINTFISGKGGFTDCRIKDVVFAGYTGSAVNQIYDGLEVRGNGGDYANYKSGMATFSGDGSTTTFSINHGVSNKVASPDACPFSVTPASADAGAAEIDYVTVDIDTMDVTFKSAPASGTDNIKLSWQVGYD